MPQDRKPRIWQAFVVPAALGIFYCVVLCLAFPHLASNFPVHFDAAGTPDRWAATGPMLLASLVVIGLLFFVLGISLIYSAEKRLGWWIAGLVFAAFIGATVGASIEFIHAVRSFREFHAFAWIAWALLAIPAEAIFLLIPRWPARQSRS
jgi:hypothetical protein